MDDYRWQKTIGEIDIDFAVEGDEWLVLFGEVLTDLDPDFAFMGWEYNSDSAWVVVRLNMGVSILISHRSEPVEVRVVARSEPEKVILETLRSTISGVSERIGGERLEHSWTAVLVQTPRSLASPAERLSENTIIGNLCLEPLDLIFKDPFSPLPTGSIFGSTWGVRQSIPIRVRGSSAGYAWREDASGVAARTLRSLCGLLSLCWEQVYEVGEPAAPLTWGQRQGRERRAWHREPIDDLGNDPHWSDHVVPDWLDAAWAALQNSTSLSAAVDVFLEAKYAEERHPSLAVVAYTSSIETIASMLYKHQRCPECNGQQNIAYGFRSALREVLSEDAANELDALYRSRSKTVHAGKLHGGETTPGLLSAGLFSGDTTEDFRSRKLPLLRQVARVLLTRALLGELPPRRDLVAGRNL